MVNRKTQSLRLGFFYFKISFSIRIGNHRPVFLFPQIVRQRHFTYCRKNCFWREFISNYKIPQGHFIESSF